MDLSHTFTVPTPVAETWEHFNDIASVAECFPGATVTGVEDDTFTGTVKVKLGPIALVYNGTGTFVEKDEASHTFLVEAKGKDKRGNGTAGATVTLSMTEAGGGGTEVQVLTDLAITGKPAQFGRGVMQDVSDKLLGQFVGCLEERLTAEPEPQPADAGAGVEAASEEQAEAAAGGAPDADDTPIGTAASAAAANGAVPPGRPVAAAPSPPRSAPADDSLDLGATVLPVLLKSYWKPAAGVALVLLVLAWLRGRRG